MLLKTISGVLLLTSSFHAFSQNYSDSGILARPNPGLHGIVFRFSGGDSGILVGTSKGKPPLPPFYVRKDSLAVLRYDRVNGKVWVYRPETGNYDTTVFAAPGNNTVPAIQQTFDASIAGGAYYSQIQQQADNREIGFRHISSDGTKQSTIDLSNSGAALFAYGAQGNAVINASTATGAVELYGANDKININGVTYHYPHTPTGMQTGQVPTITGIETDQSIDVSFVSPAGGGGGALLTFNNSGAGDASGTNYNGSTAHTVSYNTIGALNNVHPASSGNTPTIAKIFRATNVSDVSISGTDAALTFTVTIPAGKTVAGALCTITYGSAWASAPKVILGNTTLGGASTDNIRLQAQADANTINVSGNIPAPGTYSFSIFSML